MSTSATSREIVLGRIRAANGEGAGRTEGYAGLARNYIRKGGLSAEERLELMCERLREYDARVTVCAPAELPSAIADELRQSGRHILVAPEGVPQEWLAEGLEWRIDRGLDAATIESAEGVMTAAFCGVANSGTIVLHHSGPEGRRILSLLPDFHLCILYASQVVETLPEYFGRCDQPPALVTWISGPSATADIEMTRIKGVHGPRFLVVILVRD